MAALKSGQIQLESCPTHLDVLLFLWTPLAASSGRIRGGAAKLGNGKLTRRCWTPDDEKVLANALKDLPVRGYKANNGFKSGYQMLLEQAMSRSGFGLNDTTNMITVENEDSWNNFVKTDSNARNMRYETWPLYEDWVEIFGKDRATGEGVEGFADVVEEQVHNPHANLAGKENEFDGGYVLFYSNPQVDEYQSMSFSNVNHGGSSRSLDKRKRKMVDENDDRYVDLMTSFCDKTNERQGVLDLNMTRPYLGGLFMKHWGIWGARLTWKK
ncbi:hypothetical protein BUALT_Bualt03G0189000 [Buddleja alternifolia]|uniref:Myb/SANT-like domain-containing protein n=1 Tax=Buddleja alternifolia TaxID=168488 RepID=A0AAV6XWR0_9LAMI|nr:hypothetical protein BUALT_Bualt03G0189000 [Buddleja alternifolia]